jgi:hypothetical protein
MRPCELHLLEAKRLELPDSQLALAALAALPGDEATALAVVRRIGRRYGARGFDRD